MGSISNRRTGQPVRSGQREQFENEARLALTILKWQWLDDEFTGEARRALPVLLLSLYLDVGRDGGRRISKRQACDLMGVDYARTGPRYIAQAEARGLLVIDRKSAADKRKDFLRATPRLVGLIERELEGIANERVRVMGVSEINVAEQVSGDRVGEIAEGEMIAGGQEIVADRERQAPVSTPGPAGLGDKREGEKLGWKLKLLRERRLMKSRAEEVDKRARDVSPGAAAQWLLGELADDLHICGALNIPVSKVAASMMKGIEQADVLEPGHVRVDLFRGFLFEQLGRTDDALAAYRRVLERGPDRVPEVTLRAARNQIRKLSAQGKRREGAK